MLTRIDVETAEVSLCREALSATGRSLVRDGTNADLNEPIAKALAVFGVTPAVRSAVGDADIQKIPESMEQQFVDYLEIVVWETCARGILSGPQSVTFPHFSASTGGNAQWLAEAVTALRAAYNAKYLHGGSLVVGRLNEGVSHKVHEEREFGRNRRHRRYEGDI